MINNNIKKYAILLAMLFVVFTVNAQVYRTGYFLKGNSYRYRLNPSLMPERGFATLLVGNTSMNLSTNLGLADFIYDKGGQLVTFMHPDVTADEFLGRLNENNNFNFDYDMTPVAIGFYAFGGYNTIDVGLHSRFGINLPKDLFYFMKVMGGYDYQLTNMNFFTRNYADISIGHSHKINENLTIGARLKFLAGLAYAELLMDKMEIGIHGDRWRINAQGSAAMSLMGMKFMYDEDGVVNGVDGFEPGLSGIGFGVDLGATYDFSKVLTKGLIVSASVTDIGYMKWRDVSRAGVSFDEPYEFKGFENVSFNQNEGDATIGEQFEQIGEDLADLFQIKEVNGGDVTDFLAATLNIGVEYKMPFYDRLSVGALFTHRFDRMYSCTTGSLMLNWSPLKFLDLVGSASMSTLGYDWSALLNIHCSGFNIFVAADMFAGKVSKQYIPLHNMNASVMIGVNVPFGKKR